MSATKGRGHRGLGHELPAKESCSYGKPGGSLSGRMSGRCPYLGTHGLANRLRSSLIILPLVVKREPFLSREKMMSPDETKNVPAIGAGLAFALGAGGSVASEPVSYQMPRFMSEGHQCQPGVRFVYLDQRYGIVWFDVTPTANIGRQVVRV